MTSRDDPTLSHLTADLAGQRVPGGCADCDAYQTMRRIGDGLYVLTVHHDDTCPTYNAHARLR